MKACVPWTSSKLEMRGTSGEDEARASLSPGIGDRLEAVLNVEVGRCGDWTANDVQAALELADDEGAAGRRRRGGG